MTLNERMAKARELLETPPMVGRFIEPIQAGSLRNHTVCGVVTGFSFDLNNLSYRGIWLSTFEDIKIAIDDKEVPQDHIVLSVKGIKIPIRDLGGHSEVFWGAEDNCRLIVYQIGGLEPGSHHVSIDFVRRNDFGHTVGNGAEGYEEALEFIHAQHVHDEAEMQIKEAKG